jgi:phosphoserine phosphatase RsbU/P
MTEHILDKAPCGYFSFTDDSLILQVNDTLCSLLQYQTPELTGKNVESIFTISTRIFFQTHLFPLVKMQTYAEEIFLILLAKNGTHLPVLLNAKRMEWQQQTITACAFIVVPNRKKFEDDLVAARNTAETALRENTDLQKARMDIQQHAKQLELQMQLVKNQNYELQQFSHVITHNLKEPLRKILLYSSRMQETITSPDMEKLVRSSHQLLSVVTALQEYVWLNEKGNVFTKVSLNAVVQRAVQKLQPILAGAELDLHYNDLPFLTGDREQLELMMYHILLNAVKFRRGDQAEVTITSTILKQNRFALVEDRYNYEDYVRLEITDKGIGFDPVYSRHIFELFRKLHSGDGQGLGLALCKKIADNHGGSIEAHGSVDAFTTVTVLLPVYQTATS